MMPGCHGNREIDQKLGKNSVYAGQKIRKSIQTWKVILCTVILRR